MGKTECVLEIKNMTKNYPDFSIKHMDLSMTKGCIHGFIGQNGAGKTTTIRAILNMIGIEDGQIKVFEKDHIVEELSIKEDIGVVLDEMGFHEYMNPKQIGIMMRGIFKNWDDTLYTAYLNRFGLPPNRACGKFSRGMRMKLQIAVALSHHARLLLMDEPTSGLDPIVRNEILDIFQEFVEDEKNSIFLSSHILSDLERIADEITFINKGKILLSGNKDEILLAHGLMKCAKEDAAYIEDSDVIYKQFSSYGAEILTAKKEFCQKKYSGIVMESATLEEIMLFYVAYQNASNGQSTAKTNSIQK